MRRPPRSGVQVRGRRTASSRSDQLGDAFAAAVDAQARLRAEAWPDDGVIRVRMGLHTGIAFPRDGDYIALALHQAARVVGAGNGGQVIASAETIVAAGEVEGLRIERVGAYRLRDFDVPAELYQVAAVDDPRRAVPTVAGGAGGRPQPRPVPRTSFVGRADEVVELAELVQPGRLVSLVGPGGMGKTRLSARVRARRGVGVERRRVDGRPRHRRTGPADHRCGRRGARREPG